MDKVNYFLVLEKRLGDYNIIDINRLDICKNTVTNEIMSIDSFTCMFTEEEIKASINRCNISQNDYLDGSLKIISDMKHNLRVLTKEVFMVIRDFQLNTEELDRELRNKLFGIYKKTIENIYSDNSLIQGLLDRFKLSLKDNKKNEIFSILEELPYYKSRIIYLHLFDDIVKRKQNNLRKLEKLDDVS